MQPTSPATPARSHLLTRLWPRSLPALIAGGWILFDLLLLAASYLPKAFEPSEVWLMIVLGFVFPQLSYGGLWAAYGPGRADLRIPLILAGTALAIAAFFRQCVVRNELEVWFLGYFLALLLLFQGFVILLGVLSQRLLGWRIVWQGDSPSRSATQFAVRDMLYWMTGVGVLIVFLRFVFGAVVFSTIITGHAEDFVIAIVVLASVLVQTAIAAWAAFPLAAKSRRHWLGLGVCVVLAFFCAAPIAVGWGWQQYLIVTPFLILHYGVLWSQLALLHSQGLRLVEETSRSSFTT